MKVLIADKAANEGIEVLKKANLEVDVKTGLSEQQLIDIIADYDAMMVRSETKVTAKIIDAMTKMKIIGRAGVGVDNIDVAAATKKGIIVVNSPEGNTIAAAEHTFAMILALARNIPQAVASMKQNKWEKSKFIGTELYGKTLGVVGAGKIGSRVISYALAFGMKVIVHDPFITKEYAENLGVEIKSFDELLKVSDFITFHIPKSKETLHLINKSKFALMKDGVRIINVARGGIIDENDLKEALISRKVAGVALDVFEVEPLKENIFAEFDNVITTPHLGASTVEAQINVSKDVAEQIVAVLNGEPAKAAVNIPSMKPEVLRQVKPYLNLSQKIGKFISQISSEPISSVEISYLGSLSSLDTAPLTISVLKGILEPALGDSVNLVNASIIAKERGINVKEIKSDSSENFSNLISVKVNSPKTSTSVAGTVSSTFGERIVKIDNFSTDVAPAGYLLITSHIDQPGIIGKVGMLLGDEKINIASMDVGREAIGGKAVMILSVDNPIPKEILNKIKNISGITDAKLVKL